MTYDWKRKLFVEYELFHLLKQENSSDEEYLQYCDTCQGYKAPRSHHCRKCKLCILDLMTFIELFDLYSLFHNKSHKLIFPLRWSLYHENGSPLSLDQ